MPRYGTPNIGLHDVVLLTNFFAILFSSCCTNSVKNTFSGQFNSRCVKSQGVFISFIGNVIIVFGSDVIG